MMSVEQMQAYMSHHSMHMGQFETKSYPTFIRKAVESSDEEGHHEIK